MNEADKFDADGKATLLFIRDEKKKVAKLQMEAQVLSLTDERIIFEACN